MERKRANWGQHRFVKNQLSRQVQDGFKAEQISDGTIICIGGYTLNIHTKVASPMILDPDLNVSHGSPMNRPRWYHETALV